MIEGLPVTAISLLRRSLPIAALAMAFVLAAIVAPPGHADEHGRGGDNGSESTDNDDNGDETGDANHADDARDTGKITILVIDGGDGEGSGQPVKGATVTLTRRDGGGPQLSEKTRGSGKASFKKVEHGTVVIRVHIEGYSTGGVTIDLGSAEESVIIEIEPAPDPDG